jgi:hypothetical protein
MLVQAANMVVGTRIATCLLLVHGLKSSPNCHLVLPNHITTHQAIHWTISFHISFDPELI